MPGEPPDQLQYLRDTVDAYRRRFDRETDEEMRRYLWQRLLELESQLTRQSKVMRKRRGRDSGPTGPALDDVDARPRA